MPISRDRSEQDLWRILLSGSRGQSPQQMVANTYSYSPATKYSIQEMLAIQNGVPRNSLSVAQLLHANLKSTLSLGNNNNQYSVQELLDLANQNSVSVGTLLNTTTTVTFNPDANPETSSFDGRALRTGVDETWATLRTSAGTFSDDTAANANVVFAAASTTTNQFQQITRGFFLFDTSSLPDNATISAATLKLYPNSTDNALGNLSLVVVASNPASNTAIANADYTTAGSTALSNTIAINSVTLSTYNTWTLNASGIAAISKTGVTKLGLVFEEDRANSAPAWISNAQARINTDLADGTNKPILSITYT